MTTHNPIFTGTAVVVALVVLAIQLAGVAIGRLHGCCKRVDAAVDGLLK